MQGVQFYAILKGNWAERNQAPNLLGTLSKAERHVSAISYTFKT
jgi:hypothetical protein